MNVVPARQKAPKQTDSGNPSNVLTIGRALLHNDRLHAGKMLAYDTFTNRAVMLRELPHPDFPSDPGFKAREWTDADTVTFMKWLIDNDYRNPKRHDVDAALMAEADRNRFSSAARMLEELEPWDGTDYLTTWLIDYFHADTGKGEDEPWIVDRRIRYLHAVGRLMVIGMVARIMQPGCKLDTMVVLEGEQGTRKSSSLRVLAFDKNEYFSDSLPLQLGSKDTRTHLSGRIILEMSELVQLVTSPSNSAKSFISASDDKLRPPFGKSDITLLRSCVFVGTTNDDEYLKDATGNRRYLPVRCGMIDLDGVKAIRSQLWAQALAAWRGGEHWYIDDDDTDLLEAARYEQRQRIIGDSWVRSIRSEIENKEEEAIARGDVFFYIDIDDVISSVLSIDTDKQHPGMRERVGRTLNKLGGEKFRQRINGIRVRCHRFVVGGTK